MLDKVGKIDFLQVSLFRFYLFHVEFFSEKPRLDNKGKLQTYIIPIVLNIILQQLKLFID